MRFDLVTLSLFLAAYEERSLAKAAEREHIALSALSKRISDMEQMLHGELFIRSYRGIEPTSLAKELVHSVRNVMRELQQIEEMAEQENSGISGYVRIYTTMAATCQYLPKELSAFLQAHPGIRIDLQEEVSKNVAEAVRTGAADIGIMFQSAGIGALQTFPYHADLLTALVPAGHPLTAQQSVRFSQLLDYELVGPLKGSTLESLILKAAYDLGYTIKPRMRISAFDTLCQMVQENLGVAIVPKRYLDQLNRTIGVVPIELDEEWATRQLCLCIKDIEHLTVAARTLVGYFQAQQHS